MRASDSLGHHAEAGHAAGLKQQRHRLRCSSTRPAARCTVDMPMKRLAEEISGASLRVVRDAAFPTARTSSRRRRRQTNWLLVCDDCLFEPSRVIKGRQEFTARSLATGVGEDARQREIVYPYANVTQSNAGSKFWLCPRHQVGTSALGADCDTEKSAERQHLADLLRPARGRA